MTPPSGLAARLAALRRLQGRSQAALAQALGVSRSAVAQWETGRAAPHHAHLLQLAAYYAVSLEYLLFGEDKRAALAAQSGDEAALLRLFRELSPADRAALLREALRLARGGAEGGSSAAPPAPAPKRKRGLGRGGGKGEEPEREAAPGPRPVERRTGGGGEGNLHQIYAKES
jgi:transcriptional regulator with XRE-family HTH domain